MYPEDIGIEPLSPGEQDQIEDFGATAFAHPEEGSEQIADRVFGPGGWRRIRTIVRVRCMAAYDLAIRMNRE